MEVIFSASLSNAFERAGLPFPEREPEPGRLVRFSTNGRKDDAAGWLRLFPDMDGAAFGNWRDGAAFTWQRQKDGPPPDPAEMQRIRQRAEEARKAAETEREAGYQKAARKALATWQAAETAREHPYLTRKGIGPHSARIRAGWLVLPVHDKAGNLQSVQSIGPDLSNPRNKLFMSGGKMQGGRCWLGEPTDAGPLALCEGFATGASIREATGWPVCVTFTAGNLRPVACDVREAFPRAKLVICGDDDRKTEGNPGRQKALEAAKVVNGLAVFPVVSGPEGTDFNDMAQQSGREAVRRLLLEASEPPQRFRLLNPAELASLPPVRWRVRGVLPEEGIAALYGPSGSGKSFLALDMLAAVAAGRPWFGRRVKPALVLYVALEGEAGISQRIQAHQMRHGPLAAGFRFLLQPLDIRNAADRTDLARAARAAGCVGGVLCLDTLNRAAPGADENDSASMGEIIAATKALQAELGGLVLLVHHTGKDASKGLRGHSSLHAALDAAVEVSRTDDRREWRTSKSKDGSDDDAQPFRLEVLTIGADEDGEDVTSCAVVPETNPTREAQHPAAPRGANMRLCLQSITAAITATLHATPRFGMNGAPPGRPCIQFDAAMDAAAAAIPCEQKRKRERAQQAMTALVSGGHLAHREGWVWLP